MDRFLTVMVTGHATGSNHYCNGQQYTLCRLWTQDAKLVAHYQRFGRSNSKHGVAAFKTGTVVSSSDFVKAKTIQVQPGAFVPNRFNTPANDGPNPPFFAFAGTTSSLPSLTLTSSPASPVSANYKSLTIKKNVTVTITGTLYGKIDIQEGATVTFAPVGGIINIESLTATGKLINLTRINFSNCTSVRIKDNVVIDQSSLVNVDGPKVTFYLGDNNNDDEQFLVKGDNNIISANVYIKKGSLNVNGNIILMKGWFIAEKIENDGKMVVWNDNDCSSSTDVREFTKANMKTPEDDVKKINVKELTVKANPNPSADQFTLQIQSDKDVPVTVKVTDINGRLISLQPGVASNCNLRVGGGWMNGVYFVEISQGNERKVIRLVKL
jgi:hypothetical protein